MQALIVFSIGMTAQLQRYIASCGACQRRYNIANRVLLWLASLLLLLCFS